MKRVIALFLIGAALFGIGGCKQEPSVARVASGGEEKAYELLELETGKLSTVPLDTAGPLSRCAYTGRNFTAETEQGYYYCVYSTLYYCDKGNMTKWVPVCNKPECSHTPESINCDAHIEEFVIDGDVIYYYCDAEDAPFYLPGYEHARGFLLAKMNLDGSGKELAYVVKHALQGEQGGMSTFGLSQDRLIGGMVVMQENGTFSGKIFRVDEHGERVLLEQTVENYSYPLASSANLMMRMNGDDAICSTLLTGQVTELYDATGEQLEEIGSVAGLDIYGAYLRGSTLLTFLPGEGYYTMDIATGERVKAADRQLSSGWGFVFQPNCILETTVPIGWRGSGPASQGGEGLEMVLYDGTSWRPVTLPQELGELEEWDYLEPLTLGSDRILFSLHRETGRSCRIYQLPLHGDSLEVTFCAEIGK